MELDDAQRSNLSRFARALRDSQLVDFSPEERAQQVALPPTDDDLKPEEIRSLRLYLALNDDASTHIYAHFDDTIRALGLVEALSRTAVHTTFLPLARLISTCLWVI